MNAAQVVDEIEAIYTERGGEAYGEQVTLFEHSLLTAGTARAAGASPALIAAALLHDIGHLLTTPDSEFGMYDIFWRCRADRQAWPGIAALYQGKRSIQVFLGCAVTAS